MSAHAEAVTTNTNDRFYERACAELVRLTVSISGPRQSVKLKSGEEDLAQRHQAKTNTSITLIPKELQASWRKAQRDLKSELGDQGWMMSSDSGGTKFIVPVGNLESSMEAVARCREACRVAAEQYVLKGIDVSDVAGQAQAWADFRSECLQNAGQLDLPVDAFPYDNAVQYIGHFTVTSRLEPLTATGPAHLPPEVVQQIAADACGFLDELLDQIRNRIADECDRLAEKLGGDSRVTRPSFNALLDMCLMAGAVTDDTAPGIQRLATGFPKYLDAIDNFSVFGPSTETNKSFDAAYCAQMQQSLRNSAIMLRNECSETV
jgi:hypothetical protein